MNESIEFLLRAVNRRAEKLANQELARFDLTSTQFRTLMYLSHHPPQTVRQCDLEVFFSKSNPAVTGILNNMEQKDLIRRVCNLADARSKVLELTEKGLALLPQLDALCEGAVPCLCAQPVLCSSLPSGTSAITLSADS